MAKEVSVFVIVFVGIIVGLFYGIVLLNQSSTRAACDTWTEQTDREVKYVENFPWYSDCLVKTESGWISGAHLYQNETPDIKEAK